MAILGGSPLGLVGLNSQDTNNVFGNYNNRSRNSGTGMVSLFSGDRIVRPFGIKIKGESSGSNSDFDNDNTVHSNDIYDTSINNIVERLRGTQAELKLMDFAYLKDVGVYPNNRLMIARRFATPVQDNIMYNNDEGYTKSLVTMIGWKKESEDFLDISFGEDWEDVGDGSFTSILDEVGADFKIPGNLGKYLESGAGAVPLPGFSEVVQRSVLEKLGIYENGAANQIPEGNPNLIKAAKQRKMIKAGSPGSGLKCKVSIKMECVWEQKYIQGIDPTLAWMDIISMVGRFGTSTSQTYGLSKDLGKNIQNLLNNPDKLIEAIIDGVSIGINKLVDKLGDLIKNATNSIKEKFKTPSKVEEEAKKQKEQLDAIEDKDKQAEFLNNQSVDSQSSVFTEIVKGMADTANKILKATVQKYRERIIGIINVLTGLPSTPWHITLGNPLRPVFCSGDMVTTDVKLNLGSSLSFNDLPTKITAEFTLENTRPWGLQEIMAKFNSGYLRVLSYANDDKGLLINKKIGDFSIIDDGSTSIVNGVDLELTPNSNRVGLNTNSNINPVPTTDRINTENRIPTTNLPIDEVEQINSDPNSLLPLI